MNSTSEAPLGLYESRGLAGTVPPMSLESPAASLPVPVDVRPPATALETALANIAKLDASMTQAAHARFDGRNNAFVRWAATHGKTVHLLSAVVPAMVSYGAVAALGDQASLLGVLVPWLAGTVGICAGAVTHGVWDQKRAGGDEPLTRLDLTSTTTWISEMPAHERALLEPYADRALKHMVHSKSLTSPAAEVLRNTLRDGTGDLSADMRIGRAAVLVRDAMTHGLTDWTAWKAWIGEMTTLLIAPSKERRDLATMLLAYCFKDELCTLPIPPGQADALYSELRAAQRASSE